VEGRRPQLLEAGLFVVVVATPLAIFPMAFQPFSDLKLVLLLLGTTLLFASGTAISRRLLWPVVAWLGAIVLATVFGTDPLGSIVGTWEGTGALLLVACAGLALVGPSLGDRDADRLRSMLLGSAGVAAAIALVWLLAPSLFTSIGSHLDLSASTVGNPVLLAVFLAAAIPAAISTGSTRASLVAAVLLGAAFAANGQRSALLLPVVAIALSVWWLPDRRRRTALVAVVLLASAALWALAPPVDSLLRSTEAQFTTAAGERQRAAELEANARGFLRRPVLGWGPGLTWNAYVSTASASEIQVATRAWNDAHDLPLQMFVTTGVLGGSAFVLVAALLVIGATRAPARRRWLVVSAVVIGVGSLYEPLSLTLTPLLFFFAAASSPDPPRQPVDPRGMRPAAIAALCACTIVAGVALTAASFEEWGRTHFAEWSLRTAVAIQPGRLSAQEELAIQRAIDGRGGDARAAAEARSIIGQAVEQHPWDPNVRLIASDVERLLKDFPASDEWLRRQSVRFPNDDLALRSPVSGG
jgi:O-antigen ligase